MYQLGKRRDEITSVPKTYPDNLLNAGKSKQNLDFLITLHHLRGIRGGRRLVNV